MFKAGDSSSRGCEFESHKRRHCYYLLLCTVLLNQSMFITRQAWHCNSGYWVAVGLKNENPAFWFRKK